MLSFSCLETGQISIEYMDNNTKILSPNKIAIFNPHQVHQSTKSNIDTKGYYTLYLDTVWCTILQKEFLKIEEDLLSFKSNIITDKTNYLSFLKLCQKINSKKDINSSEDEIKEFIINIISKYYHFSSKQTQRTKTTQMINSVKNYILANLDDNLTLDDIASRTGYNKIYISRIFKKEFGITPHAFMVNEKINLSQRLLLKDNLIVDVASSAGFYDQSHFVRNFKKVFGISPNCYKS